MSRLANQLRLIRDAYNRVAADPSDSEAQGSLAAANMVLGEIIADAEADGPAGSVAAEKARLEQLEQASLAARKPLAKAAEDEGDIDAAALESFLRTVIPGEEKVRVTGSSTVSRGMSKKTVLVTLADNSVLPSDIVLRIDRSANNYLGTTVIEEYPILELLWRHGTRIPKPFVLEPTGDVLGDRFIVFARASGVPVGGNYVNPPRDAGLIADVATRLAEFHAVPVDPWVRPDQPQGRAYIDQEIDEHLADYRALGETSAIMDAAFDWILANKAHAYGPPVLAHNDYNFNNMLIEDMRLSAMLDWEFGHVGTAAADLGYFHYAAEGGASFEAFLAAYAAAGGVVPPKEQLDFYILWGQLRLAVMGFKAVRGFEDGKFDDVRFGMSRWHRRQGLLRLAEFLERH